MAMKLLTTIRKHVGPIAPAPVEAAPAPVEATPAAAVTEQDALAQALVALNQAEAVIEGLQKS